MAVTTTIGPTPAAPADVAAQASAMQERRERLVVTINERDGGMQGWILPEVQSPDAVKFFVGLIADHAPDYARALRDELVKRVAD